MKWELVAMVLVDDQTSEIVMAFSPSSFFIGVGTVLLTIGVGFGGGVLMTDALVGNSSRESSKLEQRLADKPDEKVRPVTAGVSAAKAKPIEVPAAPSPRPAQAHQVSQPAPAPQPAVQDSYAKAQEADIRKEQQREERRARRAEQRRMATERKRRNAEQRAIARARQEEQVAQRRSPERITERVERTEGTFVPFNLDD
jgi:hypothetical protein